MPMSLEKVRAALLSGDTIMVTQIAEPESKAGTYYTLRASGKTVPRKAFEALKDELVPVDPGLFDDTPPPPGSGPRAETPLTFGALAPRTTEGRNDE